VLDGYPLIYHLVTQGSTAVSLSGRSAAKTILALSIFGDTQNSASGTPVAQCTMSGLFCNSLTYSLPVDGSFTESVTLVGSNKVWRSSGFTFTGTIFDNTDVPLAVTSGTGGVQRRENLVLATTRLPGGAGGVAGVSSSGTIDSTTDGFCQANVQNITVSTDLGRDALNALGHKNPYFRFVNFPVEVTTEIEIIALSGDWISATEDGVASDGNNLTAHTILVVCEDSTQLDCGSQNKLSSVTYGGADAGGGNATVTYTYSNFNDLTVSHNQDPG
jgi:hypothetical protein